MRHLSLAFLAIIGLALVGCNSEPAASTDSTNASTPSNTAQAEVAKCELCGADTPKAELAMHDGKMACKKCIASHNH